MKVLFVDDEKIIRDGIREIIRWDQLGCELMETADSADSAIQAMQKERFDLVITDICMQKMTGIELAKRIRRIKSDTKIIILSAFEDFSYAREAIEIGVMKYMLKPVTPEELETAVREAMDQVQSDMQLASRITESEKFVNIYRPQLVKDFWRALLQREITEQNDLEQKMKLAGINADSPTLCCIMVKAELSEKVEEHILQRTVQSAEEVLEKCLECIGYGAGQAVIITEKLLDNEKMIRLHNRIENIWGTPVRISCGHQVSNYLELSASLEAAIMRIPGRQKNAVEDLVAESVKLIEQNIGNEKFGVNEIAVALHISLSYLSKIFKKHLGATCIEYITQKRMEKAKELLIHTAMTQEEIAHAVGYTNVHYFSMLFKKQLGETPGQYRRQVRK
ncbi:MAG: response regulator [Ruminococcus sp.]|nr:response regulator [Ruminococcus sp.]